MLSACSYYPPHQPPERLLLEESSGRITSSTTPVSYSILSVRPSVRSASRLQTRGSPGAERSLGTGTPLQSWSPFKARGGRPPYPCDRGENRGARPRPDTARPKPPGHKPPPRLPPPSPPRRQPPPPSSSSSSSPPTPEKAEIAGSRAI
ncbi:hypothetical protein VPH35_124308 [Triticum aestivum]